MSIPRGYHILKPLCRLNNKTGVDSIIEKINSGTYDPYDILSNYRTFLQNNRNISNTTLKQEIITIKNFLEYSDVNISPRKFKLKV